MSTWCENEFLFCKKTPYILDWFKEDEIINVRVSVGNKKIARKVFKSFVKSAKKQKHLYIDEDSDKEIFASFEINDEWYYLILEISYENLFPKIYVSLTEIEFEYDEE